MIIAEETSAPAEPALMDMSAIDRLLLHAKRAKANDRVKQLDNQIAAVGLTITNLQAEYAEQKKQIDKYYSQKNTYQLKLSELHSLYEHISDKDLAEEARRSLEDYIAGSEMEMEHQTAIAKETQGRIEGERTDLAKLELERSKFPRDIVPELEPPTEAPTEEELDDSEADVDLSAAIHTATTSQHRQTHPVNEERRREHHDRLCVHERSCQAPL